jgi:hypothetical protein
MSQAEAKIKDAAGAGDKSNTQDDAGTQSAYPTFAAAGRTFTKWLNDRLSRTNKPTIALGTKTATVIMLRDDGTLVVDVDGDEVKGERQFIALDAKHLDALMPQLKPVS